MNARATAAGILAGVLGERRSLTVVLPLALQRVSDAKMRALVRDLCYGTLRWQPRLDAIARHLLRKPLKRKDADIHGLLLLGLYQLLCLRVPPHAAVAETVEAARALGKPWATGLVNGVLRAFQREKDTLLAGVDRSIAARLAHPDWLLERLKTDWPDRWLDIVAANNERPPMGLRVNLARTSRAACLEALSAAGVSGRPGRHGPAAVVLDEPLDVERLPGFREGRVSVQDPAAQLAASLLDLRPGMRILDACAAPGGKTGHILEMEPALAEVIALDVDGGRLARVKENLERLKLSAHLLAGDALDPDAWWDGRPFDRILLDAPCSASGVLRRHPDVKVLRTGADVEKLARAQRALLHALWPLLASGGMLLYVTCSVFRQENEQVIAAFLEKERTSARERKILAPWGRECVHGRQILPGEEDGMDGFYYACLEKR